jgi:diadenosine tetraphosphate (Ap4A) HIT family hydrolase
VPTLFTKIINGELPARFAYRDELCVVFMSINPITTGHALVVPVQEIDQWTDLPVELSQHLFLIASNIGKAQKRAFGCERAGLIVAGFEVDHCHIHVIPTNSIDDLSFANAASHVEGQLLQDACDRIKDQLIS